MANHKFRSKYKIKKGKYIITLAARVLHVRKVSRNFVLLLKKEYTLCIMTLHLCALSCKCHHGCTCPIMTNRCIYYLHGRPTRSVTQILLCLWCTVSLTSLVWLVPKRKVRLQDIAVNHPQPNKKFCLPATTHSESLLLLHDVSGSGIH